MKKDIDYYMSLPYHIEIHQEPDGTYVGRVVEFGVCFSEADTIPELMEQIEDAKRCWIEGNLESGAPIPEPEDHEYSGQLRLRMPSSLHRKLARTAKREHVSLNQYIVYRLSETPTGAKNTSN